MRMEFTYAAFTHVSRMAAALRCHLLVQMRQKKGTRETRVDRRGDMPKV